MAETVKKRPPERSANFLKKIHYALGGAALIGAEVFTPAAAILTGFAAWEGIHGAFWQVIERRVKKH